MNVNTKVYDVENHLKMLTIEGNADNVTAFLTKYPDACWGMSFQIAVQHKNFLVITAMIKHVFNFLCPSEVYNSCPLDVLVHIIMQTPEDTMHLCRMFWMRLDEELTYEKYTQDEPLYDTLATTVLKQYPKINTKYIIRFMQRGLAGIVKVTTPYISEEHDTETIYEEF